MENCMFPMEWLRVTGKPGTGGHAGSRAVDFGGADAGQDKVYAPFSGTVIRQRKNANGELYLVSDAPVLFADGTSDFCTVTFIHDAQFNQPEKVHVAQGQYIYDEGGMGGGNPTKFSNHLHLEVSRGKVLAAQSRNAYGVYCTANQMDVFAAMWLGTDVVILDGGGLPWKRLAAPPPPKPQPIPRIYTVQTGDSWWLIAQMQLGSGAKMYRLALANGKTIESKLIPGDKLTLEV